jgi:hypothetical protein
MISEPCLLVVKQHLVIRVSRQRLMMLNGSLLVQGQCWYVAKYYVYIRFMFTLA